MTDTPTIALYYREHDPMKRKMFLDQSIAAGEDEEANAVRKELWELRYGEPSEAGSGTRADGYLALWMAMEYNKDTAGKLFGLKRARKEIGKNLTLCTFLTDMDNPAQDRVIGLILLAEFHIGFDHMAAFSVKQFSVKLTFLLHFSEFQPGKIFPDFFSGPL